MSCFLLLVGPAACRSHAHQACPDVGRWDGREVAIELSSEHRPPDVLIRPSAAPANQPFFDTHPFHPAPITLKLGGKHGEPQPKAVEPAQRGNRRNSITLFMERIPPL